MQLRRVLPVWTLAPVLLLGACGGEPRPEHGPEVACNEDLLRGPDGKSYGRDLEQNCKFVDENGDVVPDEIGVTTVVPTAPSVVSSTTTTESNRGVFCTTELRFGPNGERYGRSPSQGCRFVDEQGRVLPDQ